MSERKSKEEVNILMSQVKISRDSGMTVKAISEKMGLKLSYTGYLIRKIDGKQKSSAKKDRKEVDSFLKPKKKKKKKEVDVEEPTLQNLLLRIDAFKESAEDLKDFATEVLEAQKKKAEQLFL